MCVSDEMNGTNGMCYKGICPHNPKGKESREQTRCKT
jgi:hypothetical protein